jgi:hypothetical protein
MQPVRKYARLVCLAVLVLPMAGCRGCITWGTKAEMDKTMRLLFGQVYLEGLGPVVVTSAVGIAAPPGGWGGLSIVSTETAWREWFRKAISRSIHDRDYTANFASLVAGAAAPGGCGGLSTLATVAGQEQLADRYWNDVPSPSLFEARILIAVTRRRPDGRPLPGEAR